MKVLDEMDFVGKVVPSDVHHRLLVGDGLDNRAVKKLGIDTYIDDDLDLLKYLSRNHSSLKLYWITKREKKNLPKNIQAIKTLHEIKSKL